MSVTFTGNLALWPPDSPPTHTHTHTHTKHYIDLCTVYSETKDLPYGPLSLDSNDIIPKFELSENVKTEFALTLDPFFVKHSQ